MSMNLIYDHQKLCLHKKMVIPQNILLGQMITELLNGVNPRLLKTVIADLKKEYLEEHNDILNTQEKKDHVQMVLDKISAGKYNFAKQNIDEGQKFNAFYKDAQIPLPVQERNFKCDFCQERSFKNNQSLQSHKRCCHKKIDSEQHSEEVQSKRNQGFRPVKNQKTKQTQRKLKENPVKIIQQVKEEEKKEVEKKQKEEKEEKEKSLKRYRPMSSYSFGSVDDIFYCEE